MPDFSDNNAEALIERAYRGDASADEQRELAAWRKQSFANEQTFRRTMRLLESAGALADRDRPPVPSAADIIARSAPAPRLVRRVSVGRLVPWAIAAALAIVVLRRPAAGAASWGAADVVTGTAEMTTVQLRDGSVVRLAPASRLRLVENDTARELVLEGRAFFVVAKLAARPFVVHTKAGDATALGTRFELVASTDEVRLVVVEGRVALTAGQRRVEVSGGEVSGVRDAMPIAPQRMTDADRIQDWVGKFLVFQDTPMRDAARQIERIYGVRVTPDSTIARRTVSATFTDRTAAQVLEVICSATHAKCEQTGSETVMTARP